MLREHFRCVPEIIGFSNMLSYDYNIKPLRDASSSILLPAVVNYRVADGQRMGRLKTNPKEAEAIVALMKACMEQDEYKGWAMSRSRLSNARLSKRLTQRKSFHGIFSAEIRQISKAMSVMWCSLVWSIAAMEPGRCP